MVLATTPPEICVLGDLGLRRDGRLHPVGGPKAQRLLAVFVAQRRTRLSIERLIEAMWDDEPPRSAKPTIQSQISRLRSLLSPDFAITLEPSGYLLETLGGEVDAWLFESMLTRSRTLETDESVAVLDAALGIWHGPAFAQFANVPAVLSEALRLDEMRLTATDEWAEARMASGDPAPMVGELEALVSLHPLRECYRRMLMLALYRTGRQAEALRRANEFRALLRQEVGLDLSPAVRDLEAQILADDPELLSKPTPSIRSRSSGTDAPLLLGATSFIGRDPDLLSLSEALVDQPLITVTGPGGVGKTRLAMRVAGMLIDRFEDGVTVVEFAALRDSAGTAQVIAHALDVQQRGHQTIETTIEEHLAPTRSLLLLDGCEHLTSGIAPIVARLRAACPNLRILATSRQPLGLAGEYIEALAPLTIPDPDVESIDDLRRFAAVELFIARAAASSPGFTLTDENARAVADICQRLDGLPLALELAAARVRNMGVDALAGRLHQRIEMLGQTQRGADGRQRSLHDLVKWSYDLLGPEEQQVFEQLAVFAGGFDLVAAESVCSIDNSHIPTISHLASLGDKSMVVLVTSNPLRYRLLEPLREFGLDRLRERGMLDQIEHRHLHWFLGLAERGSAGLDSPEESSWSASLTRDYDNFRAAHLTALRGHHVDDALRLVSALREFAFRRIDYEITSWANDAIQLAEADDSADLSTALGVLAYGSFVRGDMSTAIELAHRALDTPGGSELSESGLPERALGNAHFYLGQIDEALKWTYRMVLSARRADTGGRIAHGLYMHSVAQTIVGDEIRGAALAGEARAAADAVGSPSAHAQADYALGLVLKSTDPDEALALLERAGVVGAEAGNRWIEAFALTEVHSLRAAKGDHLVALAGYAEVIDIWYRGGDWANQRLSLRRVLGILVELEAFEPAAVLHGSLAAAGAAHALPIAPADAEHLSKGVDEVLTHLGPDAFAEAARRGATMSDREIVSFVQQQIALLTADSVCVDDSAVHTSQVSTHTAR